MQQQKLNIPKIHQRNLFSFYINYTDYTDMNATAKR